MAMESWSYTFRSSHAEYFMSFQLRFSLNCSLRVQWWARVLLNKHTPHPAQGPSWCAGDGLDVAGREVVSENSSHIRLFFRTISLWSQSHECRKLPVRQHIFFVRSVLEFQMHVGREWHNNCFPEQRSAWFDCQNLSGVKQHRNYI